MLAQSLRREPPPKRESVLFVSSTRSPVDIVSTQLCGCPLRRSCSREIRSASALFAARRRFIWLGDRHSGEGLLKARDQNAYSLLAIVLLVVTAVHESLKRDPLALRLLADGWVGVFFGHISEQFSHASSVASLRH